MWKKVLGMLCVFAIAGAWARPVRSAIGGRDWETEDNGPQNLWTWPTDFTTIKGLRGETVWNPQIGMWYTMASNGNSSIAERGSFTGDSVTSTIYNGYGMATFLALEPGKYNLSCNTDGDTVFRLAFYVEAEDGYVWSSAKILPRQTTGGWYNQTFTVPDGCSLVMFMPVPYNTPTILTTTDIEIYRVD